MPPINVLIKPVSSSCNLRCSYCFYRDIAENRKIYNYGIMKDEVLEVLVKKVFEYGDHFVGFVFQGGEPTIIGIDFYKRLIDLQKKYNLKKIKVNNAIQTNGIAIDAEWAQFLSRNDFLVGISLDGPKDIHDCNRIDANEKGSFNRVQKAIGFLNKYKVEFNILCVVTKLVATHTDMVYNFFSKKGFEYLQFIPCLDELNKEPGGNKYSLTPEDYGIFLKRLFDLWYKDFIEGRKVSIRLFDNIIRILLGYPPESCDMMGRCSANIVVESDGSIYPCDFYVTDEWKMGNILDDNFQDILHGEKAMDFIKISKKIFELCKKCSFFNICRGGCRRNYEPIKNGILKENYFCSSYKSFYEYALPRFYEIMEVMSRYNC